MNDPPVQALIYKMKLREGVTFENPAAIEYDEPGFHAHLEAEELRISLVEHFADEKSAMEFISPFLDAWEMDAALALHRRDFRFVFECAEVIERRPQSLGNDVTIYVTLPMFTAAGRGSVTVKRSAYPDPPRGFKVTRAVRHLWDRYEAAIDGREPAASAGYYCYTPLKALARCKKGKISWVAQALSIDECVLTKLDALTNKGDPATARKYSPAPISHTGDEINWLRMAVRVLTRRLGEWEHDRSAKLPPITMGDLPPL